jgi:hypothetical protein
MVNVDDVHAPPLHRGNSDELGEVIGQLWWCERCDKDVEVLFPTEYDVISSHPDV